MKTIKRLLNRIRHGKFIMPLDDFRSILASCARHLDPDAHAALLSLPPGTYSVGSFGRDGSPPCPWAAAGLWDLGCPTDWSFIDRFDGEVLRYFGPDTSKPQTFTVVG